jgi:hypothetical protein
MDRTPARARMTSSKWPPPLYEAGEGSSGAGGQACRKRCGGKRPRWATSGAAREDGARDGAEGEEQEEEEEGAGETRPESGSEEEAAAAPAAAPRVRLVCALLNDLPANGAFTNVTRETCEEYQKRSQPVVTHLPNYETLHPKCRNVRSDETNILVRALKIKKRNELRRKREARGQGARPAAAPGMPVEPEEPEAGARSGDEDAEVATFVNQQTPRASRGLRRSRQDIVTSTPVVTTTAVADDGAVAATAGSGSSSSSNSGEGGTGVQIGSPFAPVSEGTGLRVLCAFSPRLGASRVRTPPPTGANDVAASNTAHD